MSTDKCSYIILKTSFKVIDSLNLNQAISTVYSNQEFKKKKTVLSVFWHNMPVYKWSSLKLDLEKMYCPLNSQESVIRGTLKSMYDCLNFTQFQKHNFC